MMEIKFVASSLYTAISAYAVVSFALALPASLDQSIRSTDERNRVDCYSSRAELTSSQVYLSVAVADFVDDTRDHNADASKSIKMKREEEEVGSGDGYEEEEDEEILPMRQHDNVLRVSDLTPQLRDFISYNSPDLLGPDFFWTDLSDEEIELERIYYYEMLRNEFEELADFPLDDVLQLRSETLRQVHNIILLERQFRLERGGQETTNGKQEMSASASESASAPAEIDKLTAWLNSAASDPPTASFSSSMLASPNPSRLWTTIWELIRQEYWEFKYADVGVSLSPTLVLAVTNEMYDIPEADQGMLMSVITAAIEVMGRILPEPSR